MRTVVGLFDSWAYADSALGDLEKSGFSRSDISVIGPGDAVGSASGAGTAIGAGLGLLAGLSIIAVPGIGALAALGPILAGGLFGAVAGGLAGSLVDAGIPQHEALHYIEGVRRGGTLITVAASDDNAPRAIEIIARHHPVDIEERALLWRESGWTPGKPACSSEAGRPIGPNEPDPTGGTTMGDAAAEMPLPEDHSIHAS
jgi:hypothetical protein